MDTTKGVKTSHFCFVKAGSASANLCMSLSRVPSKNRQFCTQLRCESPWRLCIVCIQEDTVEPPNRVFRAGEMVCSFHRLHGQQVTRAEIKQGLSTVVSTKPPPRVKEVRAVSHSKAGGVSKAYREAIAKLRAETKVVDAVSVAGLMGKDYHTVYIFLKRHPELLAPTTSAAGGEQSQAAESTPPKEDVDPLVEATSLLQGKLVSAVLKMLQKGEINLATARRIAKYGDQLQEQKARLVMRGELGLHDL